MTKTNKRLWLTIRLAWWILGVVATANFIYLAVMSTAACLGLSRPPLISEGWITLGMIGAAIKMCEIAAEEFRKLRGEVA